MNMIVLVDPSDSRRLRLGHVNFLNLFNDDPQDTGIAGVDIYRMDSDGKAVEHWDTLQLVGDPKNSAPLFAPNIPRANPNGMF
jgi:hypothetical protein